MVQQGNSALAELSEALTSAVAAAGEVTVRVDARRRRGASGIVWKAEGLVLTADHVLERDEDIKVGLPNGEDRDATIVGRDPATDIAVLRVAGGNLKAATPGTEPKPGNLVLALGRGRQGASASMGIVSSVQGPVRTWSGGQLESFIYTDAVGYPGFSGGPLVDTQGNVLGLNTSGLFRGTSVTIPLAIAAAVGESILAGGRVRRGFLGVTTQIVEIPAALGQRAGITDETGLMVMGVVADGPADRGGLLLGDLLVSMGGAPIRNGDDLQQGVGSKEVGQTVALKVVRGGEPKELTVTIGERPQPSGRRS